MEYYSRILGISPEDEKGATTDQPHYYEIMKMETNEYMRLIKNKCEIPDGVIIRIKKYGEDDDDPYLVVADYPAEWLEKGHPNLKKAFAIENNVPTKYGVWFKIKLFVYKLFV